MRQYSEVSLGAQEVVPNPSAGWGISYILTSVILFWYFTALVDIADWLVLKYYIRYIKTRVVFLDLYIAYRLQFDSFGHPLPTPPPPDRHWHIIPEDVPDRLYQLNPAKIAAGTTA